MTGGRDLSLMTRRCFAMCIAVWCACSVARIHADTREPFRIGIRLILDRSIASRVITDRLKQEAEAIWEPYHVRLGWIDAGGSAPTGISFDAIVERRFEEVEPAKWTSVLGRAVLSPDPSTWQPIRVSFEATASMLALRFAGQTSLVPPVLGRNISRALGRVLAHEVGHLLLGLPGHDRVGLMRADFRPDELGDPGRAPFHLTCGGLDRLRSRLRMLAGERRLAGSLPDGSCIPGQLAP